MAEYGGVKLYQLRKPLTRGTLEISAESRTSTPEEGDGVVAKVPGVSSRAFGWANFAQFFKSPSKADCPVSTRHGGACKNDVVEEFSEEYSYGLS